MAETARPLRVFLCHAHSDKNAVKALYDRLTADGVDAWLDKAKLVPGQDWELEIREAVRESDVVVVCLSRQFNQAGFRQKEVRIALDQADMQPEGEIFIIPARLEACETLKSLQRWHWVDLFEADGYELLMRALQKRAEELGVVLLPARPSEQLLIPSGHTPAGIEIFTFGGLEFVRVPAGKFLMGSTEKNPLASDDEYPQQMFEIPYDYYIARFEVTNQDYAAFAGHTFKIPEGRKRHPVVNVDWHEARQYAAWLNDVAAEDLPQRYCICLPSEVEWEKAARGEFGNEWPWGNDFDPAKCNSSEGGPDETTPVGAYTALGGDSPYGAADMVGNVWEWTRSLWDPYPADLKERAKREDEDVSRARVVRGGAFRSDRKDVRSAYRTTGLPGDRFISLGFRVCVSSLS